MDVLYSLSEEIITSVNQVRDTSIVPSDLPDFNMSTARLTELENNVKKFASGSAKSGHSHDLALAQSANFSSPSSAVPHHQHQHQHHQHQSNLHGPSSVDDLLNEISKAKDEIRKHRDSSQSFKSKLIVRPGSLLLLPIFRENKALMLFYFYFYFFWFSTGMQREAEKKRRSNGFS